MRIKPEEAGSRSVGIAESDKWDKGSTTAASDRYSSVVFNPGMCAELFGEVLRHTKADAGRLSGTFEQRLKHERRGQTDGKRNAG